MLEATIAVMIVAGVLLTVYVQRPSREVAADNYFYSLERQILADVALGSDLRLHVLNLTNEDLSDVNYVALDGFVGRKIPGVFGYAIRVCDLGASGDFCKIEDVDIIRMIMDRDVFAEEVVISAELGDGSDSMYEPRKLRLFVWEVR